MSALLPKADIAELEEPVRSGSARCGTPCGPADNEIEKLKFMASFGHDGKSIARALDRTPQAVRVKAVELGIRLRRPSAHGRRFKISPEAWCAYQAKGEQLGTSPSGLVRLVAEMVARDDLFTAVIDAPMPQRKKRADVQPPPSFLDVFAPRTLSGLR